jgi:hypothetical protein
MPAHLSFVIFGRFSFFPGTGIQEKKKIIPVTDVTRVLQMLEASRNASRFADTIEYAMFAQASGIT